jgi:hypothetical protein
MRAASKALAASAFLFIFATEAQTSRGTVTGTVLDGSGALVAKAHLTLISADTGVRLSAASNGSGVYRFDAVDPGTYSVEVTHPGFRTYLGTAMRVEANRTTALDLHLELGATETKIDVSAEWSELLTKDSPLRGANFQASEVRDLPLVSLNPLSLARTLPGATEAAGSTVWGNGTQTGVEPNGGGFVIDGQRPRGNNYMLDGTANTDIWLAGEEQVFTISDAIQEASVQTGNFGVEFGHGAGGVLNVITKSGTNDLHGTLVWRYQSQRFTAISNLNRLTGLPKSVFSSNIYGFTFGGPLRKDKTFFFAGFQQNTRHSTANTPLQVPTADAVARLRSLFSNNPQLDLYLNALGDLRGSGAPFEVSLGVDRQTRQDRGSVRFATAAYVLPAIRDGSQWLARVDYYKSDRKRFSVRYTDDLQLTLPTDATFPGFVQENKGSHHNFLFANTYTFEPGYTNELRGSYERTDARFSTTWPESVPVASMLPSIEISNVSSPGLASSNAQFHYGNSFVLQDTQTKLMGSHALRYGAEFLAQRISQARGINDLGTISFTDAVSYSGFANFLDDFSGPSATVSRAFSVPVFHPDQFRQTYFFQDTWKVSVALTLTVGLRYENFGQPANSLPYPAFTGFDRSLFFKPSYVNTDDKDFGPAFGLAWSPLLRSGRLRRIFGGQETVWRGGYQIDYEAPFTQLLSLGPASSTPNAVNAVISAPNTGRGTSSWFEQVATIAGNPTLLDNRDAIDKNLRNPYTERWSFGFQREFPNAVLLDAAYVGSESHELTTKADLNPRLLDGVRLHPEFGPTVVRTSQGNSSYHALQAQLNRRFEHGLQIASSYTWSRLMDSTSDGAGNVNVQQPAMAQNLTSVPVSQGGLKLDHAVSDYDRPQRLTIAYLGALPGPRSGWWKWILGGWSIAGITTFQSGTPFTVANGSDRNNDGRTPDRPDVGNPSAELNTRALVMPSCATGYQNPDTGVCVGRGAVRWVESVGLPNAFTVGRNTVRTSGTNNFDVNLSKSIPLGEGRRLEFRWEALNALNHPQFVQVPPMSVKASPAGRFLNHDYTDGGIRSMWLQVKLVF